MNSILRKAMWPAALVGGLAVLFGAFGSGNVQTAYAADGDVCAIYDAGGVDRLGNPDRIFMEVDETIDLTAVFEDTGSGFDVDVNLDDYTGDAAITSLDDNGDGDTDSISPTQHLNSKETHLTDVDECGGDADLPGELVGTILDDITQCIDTDYCENDWTESGGGGVADVTTPLDVDISPTDIAVFISIELADGEDDCGDLGDSVENMLIQAGVSEGIAGDIKDDVEDLCEGDLPDYATTSEDGWFDSLGDLLDDLTFGLDSELMIDVTCYDGGVFIVSFAPEDGSEAGSIEIVCGGDAHTAEIKTQRTIVETDPTGVAPAGFGTSVITVTVFDQHDDELDGVEVTFATDNCTLKNTDPVGDSPVSPAGGGALVTTWTDTDTTADNNYVADEAVFHAGTAEVLLDCTTSAGHPGVANVTAVVQKDGADIHLEVEVTVVGGTAATGLTLTLTPDDIECGETILAVATAVDSLGQAVSDGTKIWFTTDTSSGVVGGVEGAQGGVATDDGEASVLIATDPSNSGIHTVIAYTKDAEGRVLSQVSKNYDCDGAVAPAAPTVVSPPAGTGSITPPNTGDAGLAAGSSSSSLFVLFGAVAFVVAGLASIRFARN